MQYPENLSELCMCCLFSSFSLRSSFRNNNININRIFVLSFARVLHSKRNGKATKKQ